MEDIGKMHLRMKEPGSSGRQADHLVTADIIIEKSTVFINICEHSGIWPFVIENNSNAEVSFGQVVRFSATLV